ncbi:structural constituent of ribosome, putative [Ricinus communis]|uniref:Structural constituent of ribosome, putative n=1 Tax=Ricinus communis TaxID=3988 RepID=B9RZV1_RICCO|nr:structural constituent of ribosome, putative [Ricinus communis]
MEILIHTTSTYPNPKHVNVGGGFTLNRNVNTLAFANAYTSPIPFTCNTKLSLGLRKSVIVEAKKTNKKKEDKHSFIPKPDEATGPFPEAVLLKEKKVQEDGKLLPDFADAEEVDSCIVGLGYPHYKCLTQQLPVVIGTVQHSFPFEFVLQPCPQFPLPIKTLAPGFLREKKGRIWRLNDWGMRRLAYKIQKATKAHYILMNFEIEAKWINDFKSMLDKDERVIRHLVIKRDEAITEDCPPPPEFHTMHAGVDDDDDEEEEEEEEDDIDYDDDEAYDEEWDGDMEDGIIIVNSDENEDDSTEWSNKSSLASDKGNRNWVAEKIRR